MYLKVKSHIRLQLIIIFIIDKYDNSKYVQNKPFDCFVNRKSENGEKKKVSEGLR